MINKNIFRAYDIRGNSLLDINPTIAYRIGFCFSKMHLSRQDKVTICVGMDGRLSSPSLHEALAEGLVQGGADVISIGVVPSPVLYFADTKFKPAASIMVTASHNPKDDNGFKMLSGGKSFFGLQIQELLNLIERTDWVDHRLLSSKAGRAVKYIDINKEYVERILEGLTINPRLKVAWDPGNGSGGSIIEMLKSRLPNINIAINCEIDGNFPNHHPDPTNLANLEQLINVTMSEKCHLGIGLDGDADRIGIVTNQGKMIYGDQLLCLFAKDILKAHKDRAVVMDVKTSQSVFDQIKQYGGLPIMWKTGHPLIKAKMLDINAVLGGEMSGHMFFADKYYGYDDGIYAALRILDLLSRSDQSLDDMLNTLPKVYNTAEIKIAAAEERKFQIIDAVKKHIKETGADIIDIDGIRVNTKDGWWLVRASNTSAAIIARCESNSEEGLESLKSNLFRILDAFY
jgi:phosphomannomutase